MMDLYLHTAIALVVVVGLVFLLGSFLRKRQDTGGLMAVLGYRSLGPKKGLAMVRVGAEVLLLGVTATDVKLLKTLDPGAAAQHADEADAGAVERPAVVTAGGPDRLDRLRALKDALKGTFHAVK